MSFEVLLDIMEFALNNAIVKMPEGKLLRQTKGIPMGDPLSPAMTIGACAWMEEEWMQQLDGNTKEKFVAKRYMDDILVWHMPRTKLGTISAGIVDRGGQGVCGEDDEEGGNEDRCRTTVPGPRVGQEGTDPGGPDPAPFIPNARGGDTIPYRTLIALIA